MALSKISPAKFLPRLANWFCLVCLLGASLATKADEPRSLKKVVHSYAVTSANDFAQRDPQDWRLLASNDDGKTWVTLDVRKGEIFQGRQQRKLYRTENTNVYEMYRLQIDKIRDPTTAGSVQWAEIELMGMSDDDLSPTPIFSDIISAQGDNPPSELSSRLFDGRVETKWLDFAPTSFNRASWIQWQYRPKDQAVVTNISQLVTLRPSAGDGIRVRMEALVGGSVSEGKKLFLVDITGCVEITVDNAEAFGTGQRVVVTGVTEWDDHKMGVKNASVERVGPAASENPEHIQLGQTLPWAEELKWVEVEGMIQQPHAADGEESFDINDGVSTARVHLHSPNHSVVLPPPGSSIIVRGLCLSGFNERGHRVAAQLWTSGPESIRLSNPELHEPAAAAAPHNLPKPDASAAMLTSIEQIRRLTQEQIQARPRLRIRGIVTDQLEGFVQDDTGGMEAAFVSEEKRKLTEFGQYIEINGDVGVNEVGNPRIQANHVTVLGRGKLPQPRQLSVGQLMSGQIDGEWVELEGVVRSTDGSHLLIICYGQELMASLAEANNERVNELVDAGVRVRGVGVIARDDQGRVQGIHLLVPSLDFVDVTTPPAKPEKLAARKIGSLLGLNGPMQSFHLVKVEGVVTLNDQNKIFLQDNTGSATAIIKENVTLDSRFGHSRWLYWQTPHRKAAPTADQTFVPGERVQVIGFNETRRYSPVLTEAIVTRLGLQKDVTPVPLTSDGVEQGSLDSSLVTFDGVLRGQNTIGTNSFLALEWLDRTLQVEISGYELALPKIATGSRLRVTGVCQVDPAPYAELGLGVGAIRIQARSASDLLVLARPSPWTIRRALIVIGGMASILLAALVWIKILRRQVDERTRQLSAEIQLREETERHHALAQERARIAKDLHDDLGAELTQIVFLSDRVEGAREDGQEVARWFDLIPATARRTIQSLDEIVWAINPRHDSLESLANYLSQFTQELLTVAGVRSVLDVPTVLPSLPLSAEVRHNLLLSTREALQNAVKHAGASEVRLTLKLDDTGLVIEITDNGKGFNPDSPTRDGNGLQNMRQRLEAIGGQIKITSLPDTGTTVFLSVPRKLLHLRVIGGQGVSGG